MHSWSSSRVWRAMPLRMREHSKKHAGCGAVSVRAQGGDAVDPPAFHKGVGAEAHGEVPAAWSGGLLGSNWPAAWRRGARSSMRCRCSTMWRIGDLCRPGDPSGAGTTHSQLSAAEQLPNRRDAGYIRLSGGHSRHRRHHRRICRRRSMRRASACEGGAGGVILGITAPYRLSSPGESADEAI